MNPVRAGQKRRATPTIRPEGIQGWKIDVLARIFKDNQRPSDQQVNEATLKTGLEEPWIMEWFKQRKRPTRNNDGLIQCTEINTTADCSSTPPRDSSSSALADSSTETEHASQSPSAAPPSDGRFDAPLSSKVDLHGAPEMSSNQAAVPFSHSFDRYLAPTRSFTRSPSLGYILSAFPTDPEKPAVTPPDLDQTLFDFPDLQFSEPPIQPGPDNLHQNEFIDFTTFFAPTLPATFRNSNVFSELSSSITAPTIDDLFTKQPMAPYGISFSSLQSHSTALLPGSGPPYPAPVSYITRLSDVTAVTRDIRKTRDAGLYSGMIQNTHEVNNGLGTSTHTVRVPGDDGGAEKENIHGEDGKIHVQACNVAKDEAITSEQADIVRDSSFGRKFIDPDHNYRTSKILPSSRVLRSSKRRSHTY